MKRVRRVLAAALFALAAAPSGAAERDCVILLHGLARGPASMAVIADVLRSGGYRVVNRGYASRSAPVETLAVLAIAPALAACEGRRTHFVTHSLGGILVRTWLSQRAAPNLGRVVMLAPPNQGSPLVEIYAGLPGYDWLLGPAGRQLGQAAGSLPRRLPPVSFELGVIAGDRTLNPISSGRMPGPDDGTVPVPATRVAGMRDHIVLGTTHSLITFNPMAIAQTMTFLRRGRFDRNLGWDDLLRRGLGF